MSHAIRVRAALVAVGLFAATVASQGGCPTPPPPAVIAPVDVPVAPATPAPTTPALTAPSPRSPTARPTTGTPRGPISRGPTRAPLTPIAITPVGTRACAARTGARGVPLGPDHATWNYWWEFNKHRYLKLRDSVHATTLRTGSAEFFMGGTTASTADSPRPMESDLINSVFPILERAMQEPDDRDITTAAARALAKLRVPDLEVRILEMLKSKLRSDLSVVRESAALALGIMGSPQAIPLLSAVATNSARGQKLCQLQQVGTRERAFACYGLGLAGASTVDIDHKLAAFRALADTLNEKDGRWDTQVAAIHGMRLLNPRVQRRSYKDWKLVADCVDVLWATFELDDGPGFFAVQAHIPMAIAEILGPNSPHTGRFKNAFAAELKNGTTRRALVTQSSAIALGLLCNVEDKEYSDVLLRYYRTGKDQQTRFFSLMALGEIGGSANRTSLLRELAQGSKAIEQPWCALALGVLAHGQRTVGTDRPVDTTIGRALLQSLTQTKNGPTRSACAVAIGLAGYTDAEDDLIDILRRYRDRDDLAGYACIGLGLMGSKRASDDIHEMAEASMHRGERLFNAAIALAKLDDRRIATSLATNLTQERPALVTLAATANALMFVGNRETLSSLTSLSKDKTLSDIGRAYTLAALGAVADRSRFPWYAAVSSNMNYRASTATLTDGSSGILDIL